MAQVHEARPERQIVAQIPGHGQSLRVMLASEPREGERQVCVIYHKMLVPRPLRQGLVRNLTRAFSCILDCPISFGALLLVFLADKCQAFGSLGALSRALTRSQLNSSRVNL